MEGRPLSGVACVFGNCTIPGQEAELNEWYDNIHIPDITKLGLYGPTTRFENPGAKSTAESPRFLAVYETTQADPAAAWISNRATPRRQQAPGKAGIAATLVGIFNRTGRAPSPAKGKKTTGIMAVLVNCKDPAQLAAFNDWYDSVHIPDVERSGLYFTTTRFINTNADGSQPAYLTIYETASADPFAPFRSFLKLLPAMMAQDPRAALGDVKHIAPYALIFSQTRAARP
ncbi:MAG: hypothetical protein EXR49_03000 [Dehalococcoidia bacterium]|nr:hypothetical protein [Dehalococcoidia bacterium]